LYGTPSLPSRLSDVPVLRFTLLLCFALNRHKTTLPVLKEMLPEDLLNYCQEHALLDTVLGEPETENVARLP
jgi:hypothetical protein